MYWIKNKVVARALEKKNFKKDNRKKKKSINWRKTMNNLVPICCDGIDIKHLEI